MIDEIPATFTVEHVARLTNYAILNVGMGVTPKRLTAEEREVFDLLVREIQDAPPGAIPEAVREIPLEGDESDCGDDCDGEDAPAMESIVREAGAECGANAPGGGGFQPGNTCAGEDGGEESEPNAEPLPDKPPELEPGEGGPDDPDRESAEGQGELFDKMDGQGPPRAGELPPEKQWESVAEHIDELVAEGEGTEMDAPVQSWDDLDDETKIDAQSSWEDEHYSDMQQEYVDEVIDFTLDSVTEELQEDEDFTAGALRDFMPEGLIDDDGIEDAVGENGEVNPVYLHWEGIDPEAEDVDEQLTAKWAEYADDFQTHYDSQLEEKAQEQYDQRYEEFVEGINDGGGFLDWLGEQWNDLSDDDKLLYAGHSPSETVELELPETYHPFEPLEYREKDDYKKSQLVARYVQRERSVEIMRERGIANPESTTDMLNDTVWSEWKRSSTTDWGRALQLVIKDELGFETHPEYELDRQEIVAGVGASNYEALKSYVRATWESSQYVMEKAGKDKVTIWRGLMLNGDELKQYDVKERDFTEHALPRKYEQLTYWEYTRNGAQSCTTDPGTANSWGGVGKLPPNPKRVVMRMEVDRHGILSLPVHGQNLQHENEVVMTSHGWNRWHAFVGTAPHLPFSVAP